MSNPDEVTEFRLPEVKEIVTPLKAVVAPAVKSVKVATPVAGVTVPLPPKVYPPPSAAAVTSPVPEAVRLLYWSANFTIGWVASAPPFVAGATGCVVRTNLVATPAPRGWVTVVAA